MPSLLPCPNEQSLCNFADGRLPPEELEHIIEHLESCPVCLDKLDALHSQEMRPSIAAKFETPAETERNDALIRRMRAFAVSQPTQSREQARSASEAPRRRSLRVALLAACVLLVLVATGLLIANRPRGQVPANPNVVGKIRPHVSLLPTEGDLDIVIFESANANSNEFALGNPMRQNVRLHHEAALPLTPRDWIRIEATLDKPAYLYVVWIDTEGAATPIFPWRNYDWHQTPDEESPRKEFHYPSGKEISPLTAGPPGVETVLLLARAEPLSPEEYGAIPGFFPKQSRKSAVSRQPRFAVWLENGEREVKASLVRGPIRPGIIAGIDDPEMQARDLINNVKHLFPYSRAVLFGNTGKKQ